ncbi:MAG TPA: hypothetical protein DCS83_03490 [Prevotella sp.]|nr:hypothetical protein [Prevotella sp.]
MTDHKSILKAILPRLPLFEEDSYSLMSITNDSPCVLSTSQLLGISPDDVFKVISGLPFYKNKNDVSNTLPNALYIPTDIWLNIGDHLVKSTKSEKQVDMFITVGNDIGTLKDIVDGAESNNKDIIEYIKTLVCHNGLSTDDLTRIIHAGNLSFKAYDKPFIPYEHFSDYEHSHGSNQPNLIVRNDPTGSGKSRNIFGKFFSRYSNDFEDSNSDIASLIYVAPQRKHLRDVCDVRFARERLIPIVYLRAKRDTVQIDGYDIYESECRNEEYSVLLMWNDIHSLWKKVWNKSGTSAHSQIVSLICRLDPKGRWKPSKQIEAVMTYEEGNDEDEVGKEYEIEYPHLKQFDADLNRYTSVIKTISEDDGSDRSIAEMKLLSSGMNIAAFICATMPDVELNKTLKSGYLQSIGHNYDNDYLSLFIYRIVSTFLPTVITLHMTTVVLSTIAKSLFPVPYLTESQNKPKRPVVKMLPIGAIISGVPMIRSLDLPKAIKDNRDEHEIWDIVKSTYMCPDIKSRYINNEKRPAPHIFFVIDEEHLNVLEVERFAKESGRLCPKERRFNILHPLACILRMYNNSQWIEREEKKNNYKISEFELKYRSVIMKGHENINQIMFNGSADMAENIKKVYRKLEHFCANNDGLYIRNSDIDTIKEICQNALLLSPKYVIGGYGLANIRIISERDASWSLMESDGTNNPTDWDDPKAPMSVMDMAQITLCFLHAAVNILKLKDIKEHIDHDKILPDRTILKVKSANQNYPWFIMMKHAMDRKNELNILFDSYEAISPDTNNSIPFAFFMPGVFFSVSQIKDTPDNSRREGYTVYDLFIEFSPPESEVNILRMLANPNCSVTLLSATRGFKDIESSNYSIPFFDHARKFLPDSIRIGGITENELKAQNRFIVDRGCNTDIRFHTVNHEKMKTFRMLNIESTSFTPDVAQIEEWEDDFTPIENEFDERMFHLFKKDYSNFESNKHRKAEIEQTIKSLMWALRTGENSIIIGNSHTYQKLLKEDMNKDYFKGNMAKTLGITLYSDKEFHGRNGIFHFGYTRDDVHKDVFLVLFDSKTASSDMFKKIMKIEKSGAQIILISSFQSAGVGLNLVIENVDGLETDFSSLFFVNIPYYTPTRTPDEGMNSTRNIKKFIRRCAFQGGRTLGSVEKENKNTFLMQEYHAEVTMSLIQAIGRIERRHHENKYSNIYFMNSGDDNLFDEIMNRYYDIFIKHRDAIANKNVVQSFSAINRSMVLLAQSYIQSNSLGDRRHKLERESIKSREMCDAIFNNGKGCFGKWMYSYRSGKEEFSWFHDFNNTIRSIVSAETLVKARDKLSHFVEQHGIIDRNVIAHLQGLAKSIAIDFDPYGKPITLYQSQNGAFYSDNTRSHDVIKPSMFYTVFDGHNVIGSGRDKNIIKRINQIDHANMTPFNHIIPSPGMRDVISGNVGENIFKVVLEMTGLNQYLIPEERFSQDMYGIYEYFDFILQNPDTGKIALIDVKKWSLRSDRILSSTKKFVSKKEHVLKYLARMGITGDMRAYYINTFLAGTERSQNIAKMIEHYTHGEQDIYFCSLFKKQHDNPNQIFISDIDIVQKHLEGVN